MAIILESLPYASRAAVRISIEPGPQGFGSKTVAHR